MIRLFFRIAFRRLQKDVLYATISVVGLTLGMACCLLLLTVVRYDNSFDRFHADAEAIVRINTIDDRIQETRTARTPVPLGPRLQDDVPGVESAVRILSKSRLQASPGSNAAAVYPVRAFLVDSTFFRVFDATTLHGDASQALRSPSGIVLTMSTAQRLFGTRTPLGETVSFQLEEGRRLFTVAAVIDDPPRASSLRYDVLLPFTHARDALPSVVGAAIMTDETVPLVHTFARLTSAEARPVVQAALDTLTAVNAPLPAFEVQPLLDIHTDTEIVGALSDPVDPQRLTIMTVLALLAVLIASINFAAILIGRAPERIKEVGVRKAIGARAHSIGVQFWGEAVLLSTLATTLGLGVAAALLPSLGQMLNRPMPYDLLFTPGGLLVTLSMVAAASLIGGVYPSLLLARLTPRSILGHASRMTGSSMLTRGITVVQFGVSAVLLLAALTVDRQVRVFETANYGTHADNVILVGTSNSITGGRVYSAFQAQARQVPSIQSVSGTAFGFGDVPLSLQLKTEAGGMTRALFNGIATDFPHTLGLSIVQGRVPSEADGRTVLINETLYEMLGGDVVGTELPVAPEDMFAAMFGGVRIGGVVRDYHFQSLHTPVAPLVLVPRGLLGDGIGSILVRARPERRAEALRALRDVWTTVAPSLPFRYRFLEDTIQASYRVEEQQRLLVTIGSSVALLLAGMGLFGLASINASRRRKEISIRKVLGASESELTARLTWELARLVGLAFVLAAPVAYVVLQRWLSDFARSASLDLSLFALAFGAVSVITLLATTVHAWRAASADPTSVLRSP